MKKEITFSILYKEDLQQQVGSFNFYGPKYVSYYLGTQNLYVRQDAGYEGTDNYEPINPGDYHLLFSFAQARQGQSSTLFIV